MGLRSDYGWVRVRVHMIIPTRGPTQTPERAHGRPARGDAGRPELELRVAGGWRPSSTRRVDPPLRRVLAGAGYSEPVW